jgi:formate dehydrogenase iron-sulfur subunit
LEPACVATCPTDALEYGERSELLQKAHARIAANPGRYLDHVYGEHENGGTSYLILSHAPFAELGLPAMPESPVNRVSEQVIGLTLPVALGVGAVLTGAAVGVHAVNQKKEAAARRKAEAEAEAEAQEEPKEEAAR